MNVWIELQKLQVEINKATVEDRKLLNLSLSAIVVLNALYENKGQSTPSELARMTGKAVTSFTPILDELEHKHYIRRTPSINGTDRRKVLINLAGRSHLPATRRYVDNVIKKINVQFGGRINHED